jgi:HK97 family phage prohead protease
MTAKTFEQRFVADAPPLEIRTDENGRRMFRGAFAVFNSRSRDLGGFKEEIAPEAFNRILARGDDVQAWFNHNPDNLLATVRANTLKLWTDERAAWYEFPFDPNDPDHHRVAAKAERGDLVGSSFGFRASGDSWGVDETDYPLRTVTEVSHLRDVGPVSTPAYPGTESVGALTFRSLQDVTGVDADKLAEASEAGELRSFLLAQATEDTAQTVDDDSDSQKDADSQPDQRTTLTLPPLPPQRPRSWYGDY